MSSLIPDFNDVKITSPFPSSVKYVYINIGTNWDPWPGCAQHFDSTKGQDNYAGLGIPYNPEIFCIYVEPQWHINKGIRERGFDNNSTVILMAAVSDVPGVFPFKTYGG